MIRPTFVRQLLADCKGSVLLIFGVTFLVLVAIAGAGFDFGRQQIVRLKLQQASDAGALAGALMPLGTTNADRQANALRYYQLNYPASYLGVARPAPTITVGAILGAQVVHVTANTNVPTSFISALGMNTLATRGDSRVALPNVTTDYDVVMVVDESSSTANSLGGQTIFAHERAAINLLLDRIIPVGSTNPNVRFGVIGYSQFIRDKWGLTSNRAQAQTAIASMNWVWMNYDHYGLQAALNMLTGNFDASVNSGTQPYPPVVAYTSPYSPVTFGQYRTENDLRVPPPRTARSDAAPNSPSRNVVFLTDGYIMEEPRGCAWGTFNNDPDAPSAECPNYSKFLAACQALKDAGVTVFTINFVSNSVGFGRNDPANLAACASVDPSTGQPRYWYAPDPAALNAILDNIGITISKVRIFQ